jgi:hypothetical protein
MPIRFQVRRGDKSKRSPGSLCVGRPSRWGNPFAVKDHGQQRAYDLHREALLGDQALARDGAVSAEPHYPMVFSRRDTSRCCR